MKYYTLKCGNRRGNTSWYCQVRKAESPAPSVAVAQWNAINHHAGKEDPARVLFDVPAAPLLSVVRDAG